MNVLVVGSGNIGTTLTNVLLEYKEALAIDQLFILKNSFHPWIAADLELLRKRGANICARSPQTGIIGLDEIQDSIEFVFDCAAAGVARANREFYDSMPRLKGACAQGSEKGFGIPFMSGVNPEAVTSQRFVHIVSCNTHGTVSILQAVTGVRLGDLVDGDFVVVRRSEDLGGHERLVAASVVARHLDPIIGTHHAIDAIDLFKTVGIAPRVQSSDITTPSQMMHAARFSINLTREVSVEEVIAAIDRSPFVAPTMKFDSNRIFELGRRYGFQGRIFEHSLVVVSNLLVLGNRVTGWLFVAQEGNTILSTLEAFLLQTEHPNRTQIFSKIKDDLLIGQY